ncbi:hypothetical protein LOK49_Contig86G00005 [Camellia lanceoleosa]|nr:hypothetical protein LOK49_Contig86G00005 [Camellia lanceoleosa]
MMNPSYGSNFIDKFLSIGFGLAQYFYRYKMTTSKLSFVDRTIASFS